MPAPEEISKLVERYTNNRKQYISSSYREADVRIEFLDPLFKALGWDLDNTQGNAPQYRDVVTEESLDVEGSTKTPDYSFRLSGVTKFFVEAKKPSVDITSDKLPAFQLKRYAWSAKLPLSILTNFEDISVYDCRFKPVKTDDPTKGRILYIPFTDLIERWDELVEIFTKEAILKGSFDKYAQEKRRGTSEVDSEILKEIEGWREELAKNIARNNELDTEEVNFAVQRLIDRILFLRICEDRGTESENQLLKIYESKRDIYKHLMVVFQLADTKYNSGLFHFLHDKKRSTKRDVISPYLKVDDKVLASIIYDLYYPNSPYQFDVIPADILGQVYEQFLGKVIKLSPSGKTAKVEEKPEVKKAGGVYYTPTYIVEYIVENTVCKLCEKKTPKEMASLKILDPACGSGSFLIVAYQKMMDKHLEWYENHSPKKYKDQIFQNQKGAWQLTLQEKKRILLNNIHGVDIDSQAVEVTKLNLLLKALEGENKESLDNFGKWFREPALPDLGTNIKCGNSLIDFDIIDHLQDLSDDKRDNELARINPFSWQEEFSEIMKAGGFDAVVGNPPYVRMEEFKKIKVYLKEQYESHEERSDLYVYFIERANTLINENGRFGMIVSNKFLRSKYGRPLREFLRQNISIERIVDFAGLPVFKGATVRTIVLLTNNMKKQKQPVLYSPPVPLDKFSAIESGSMNIENAILEYTFQLSPNALEESFWSFGKPETENLLNKLKTKYMLLAEYCDGKICMGVKSGLTKAFVMDEKTKQDIIKRNPEAREVIKPFLNGRDVRRYYIASTNLYLIYTYHGIDISQYPAIEEHLEQFKERLKNRATKQEWYELQQPQYKFSSYMAGIKIIFPDMAIRPRFTLDDTGYFSSNTTYFIPRNDPYLLGILNSKFGTFFFNKTCAGLEGKNETYLRFFGQYLENFPIRTINFSDPDDKARHDKMVQLVERMLKLHKDVKEASTPDAETRIQRQIEATDREIDQLVYELYGLSEEEIGIVEGEE